MALNRGGKIAIAVIGVLVVAGGAFAALALTGNVDKLPKILQPSEPPVCPTTGEELPEGTEPDTKPVLAIKVENTEAARPLAGLNDAEIVYEEVVEGGITRFVAIFACSSSERVGPVRSARTTDGWILRQFSQRPILAYSGAAGQVVRVLKDEGVVSLVEGDPSDGFERDSARTIPHNLFATTGPLWKVGAKRAGTDEAPRRVFTYDDEIPGKSKKAREVEIVFSTLATADWRWEGGRWVRYLGGMAMFAEDGSPIITDNIVIQRVHTTESDITDTAGYASPDVDLDGGGKVWVFRGGRVIQGTWERDGIDGVTVLRDRDGNEIPLAVGRTYVELAPYDMFDAQISIDGEPVKLGGQGEDDGATG